MIYAGKCHTQVMLTYSQHVCVCVCVCGCSHLTALISLSLVTLALRPPTLSSLRITDRSFWYASSGLWNRLPASPCHPHPSLFKGRYALPVTCKPMYGLYLRSIYASAFLDTCIYSLYVQVLKGSRVYTIHMYVCVFDTDTYGQYIRVNFSTLVHVGCIYGPCIRAIFTGSDYRP